MTKTNTLNSHRNVIRRLLDHNTAHGLATYVRMVRRETGRIMTKGQVLTTLKHMSAQSQLWFIVSGTKIVGGTVNA